MYFREGEKGSIEQVAHEFDMTHEVILCPLLGRAYVVVSDDAVPLAETLAPNASVHCGWAIKIMTQQELDAGVAEAPSLLLELDGVDLALANRLVGEGVLSHLDLAGIEPTKVAELAEIPLDRAEDIVRQAQNRASGV